MKKKIYFLIILMDRIENTISNLNIILCGGNNIIDEIFKKDLEEIRQKYIYESTKSSNHDLYDNFLKEIENLRYWIYEVKDQENKVSFVQKIVPYDYLNLHFDDFLKLLYNIRNNKEIYLKSYELNKTPEQLTNIQSIQFYISLLEKRIEDAKTLLNQFDTEENNFINKVSNNSTISYETCSDDVYNEIDINIPSIYNSATPDITPDLKSTIESLTLVGGTSAFFNENYNARLLEEELFELVKKINNKIKDIERFNKFLEKTILYNLSLRKYSIVSFKTIEKYYKLLINRQYTSFLNVNQYFIFNISIKIFTFFYKITKQNKSCIKFNNNNDTYIFFTIFLSYIAPVLDKE